MGILDEERQFNGTEIRAIREALGATQERFANKLGVSFATIYRWENGGEPSRLAQVVLRGIVSQYGLTIDKLAAVPREEQKQVSRRGRRGGRNTESTNAADKS